MDALAVNSAYAIRKAFKHLVANFLIMILMI